MDAWASMQNVRAGYHKASATILPAPSLAYPFPAPLDGISNRPPLDIRTFLLPLAAHLGLPASAFAELPPSEIIPERAAPLAALTRTRVYQRLGDAVPDRAKRLVKGLAAAWPAPAPARDAWTLPSPPAARLTLEQTLLQRCAWKLPHAKAARLLGYAPPVPFAAGLAASLEWLDFAEGRK